MIGNSKVISELKVAGAKVSIVEFEWPGGQRTKVHTTNPLLGLNLSCNVVSELSCGTDGRPGPFFAKGSLFFLPSDIYLYGTGSAGSARNILCEFEKGWLDDVSGVRTEWSPENFSSCANIKSSNIVQIMTCLAHEALSPGLLSSMLVKSLTSALAVALARYFDDVGTNERSGNQQLSPWQMRKISNYFENLNGFVPNISDMANLCGIGPRHLRRLFKQSTGQTIHEFARAACVSKAKILLRDTNLSMKKIWAQLEFSNASSFSASFRKTVGESPTTFRRRLLTSDGPTKLRK